MSNKDLTSLVKKAYEESHNYYVCEIEFNDLVLGGHPLSPDVKRKHLETQFKRQAKKAKKEGREFPSDEQMEEIIDREIGEVSGATAEEVLEDRDLESRSSFKRDAVGIYLEAYQVKACFRDILTSTGVTVSKPGSKQTGQHLIHVWSTNPVLSSSAKDETSTRLYLFRGANGKEEVLKDHDETIQKTARASGPQGERSFIKENDAVRRGKLRFCFSVAANLYPSRSKAVLRDQDIAETLGHMQDNGLGASRSQGYGQFTVVKFEKVTDIPYLRKK
jgi:hypothetical protein